MAAGVKIKLKGKAGAFADGDLLARELGLDTTNGILYMSIDGSTVTKVQEHRTTITNSATPTPTGGYHRNFFTVTALSGTGTFAAPSGNAADGNRLVVRIKDNGTARTLDFTTAGVYRAIGVTLPTTTVISKTMYLGFIYNSADSKWDCVASAIEA